MREDKRRGNCCGSVSLHSIFWIIVLFFSSLDFKVSFNGYSSGRSRSSSKEVFLFSIYFPSKKPGTTEKTLRLGHTSHTFMLWKL